jgi:hypothetical protein
MGSSLLTVDWEMSSGEHVPGEKWDDRVWREQRDRALTIFLGHIQLTNTSPKPTG